MNFLLRQACCEKCLLWLNVVTNNCDLALEKLPYLAGWYEVGLTLSGGKNVYSCSKRPNLKVGQNHFVTESCKMGIKMHTFRKILETEGFDQTAPLQSWTINSMNRAFHWHFRPHQAMLLWFVFPCDVPIRPRWTVSGVGSNCAQPAYKCFVVRSSPPRPTCDIPLSTSQTNVCFSRCICLCRGRYGGVDPNGSALFHLCNYSFLNEWGEHIIS